MTAVIAPLLTITSLPIATFRHCFDILINGCRSDYRILVIKVMVVVVVVAMAPAVVVVWW